MEPPLIKPPKWVLRASRLMKASLCQEAGVPSSVGTEALHSGPSRTLPTCLFIWLITCILSEKPVIISKVLSWVLWPVQANGQTWEGSLKFLDLLLIGRKDWGPRTCDWHLMWGSLVAWALNLWGLCKHQMVSELKWTRGVWKVGKLGGPGKKPTRSVEMLQVKTAQSPLIAWWDVMEVALCLHHHPPKNP